MLRTIRPSEGGATAIEYAIIAGLIGLGLVGSLVTTRGSLSGVYGTASKSLDPNASGPTADFAKKTVQNTIYQTSTGSDPSVFYIRRVIAVFTDGSVAYKDTNVNYGVPDALAGTYYYTDKVNNTSYRYVMDGSGKVTNVFYSINDKDGNQIGYKNYTPPDSFMYQSGVGNTAVSQDVKDVIAGAPDQVSSTQKYFVWK